MKSKQHKPILLLSPTFPSGSASEGNLYTLQQTYEQFVSSVRLVQYENPYTQQQVINAYRGEEAVLVIGSARRHPKSFFQTPFISKQGVKAPIAWLPMRYARDLKSFTQTVQEVHSRAQDDCVVALLSQKHPRFVRIVKRMHQILSKEANPFEWSSDIVIREDIVAAMEEGIGLATYFGHGRPIGWVGYYGFRAHHFNSQDKKVIGGLLSLTCKTAKRKKNELSFCEQLVLNRTCAATFGAIDSTLHTDNTRWSVGLCSAILQGAKTIGDLVLHAMPPNQTAYELYRIIGDPLAPIYTTKETTKIAQQVNTYP